MSIEKEWADSRSAFYSFNCDNCGMYCEQNKRMTKEEAIEVWNSRAVPVVQCKDCKKGNITTVHLRECVRCRPMERCMELDGYCSLGERRTENEG